MLAKAGPRALPSRRGCSWDDTAHPPFSASNHLATEMISPRLMDALPILVVPDLLGRLKEHGTLGPGAGPSRPAGPSPLPGLAPGLDDARAGALLQLAIDRGARVHLDRDEGRDRKSSLCLGDSKQETAREVPGPRCSAACSEVR